MKTTKKREKQIQPFGSHHSNQVTQTEQYNVYVSMYKSALETFFNKTPTNKGLVYRVATDIARYKKNPTRE